MEEARNILDRLRVGGVAWIGGDVTIGRDDDAFTFEVEGVAVARGSREEIASRIASFGPIDDPEIANPA